MNIYHVICNDDLGYDSYSSFVVVAETEVEARYTHPSGKWPDYQNYSWIPMNDINELTVVLLGAAAPGVGAGVVVASFHAG